MVIFIFLMEHLEMMNIEVLFNINMQIILYILQLMLVERLRISSGGQVRINTSGAAFSRSSCWWNRWSFLNALFQTSRSSGAYHKYALNASGADLGYIGSAQQISSSGVAFWFCF